MNIQHDTAVRRRLDLGRQVAQEQREAFVMTWHTEMRFAQVELRRYKTSGRGTGHDAVPFYALVLRQRMNLMAVPMLRS
jgi:hypothetical protein